MEFPVFKTEKLRLLRITAADMEDIYRGLSDPRVIEYYGVSYHSLEGTQEQMDWFAELEDAGRGLICSGLSKNRSLRCLQSLLYIIIGKFVMRPFLDVLPVMNNKKSNTIMEDKGLEPVGLWSAVAHAKCPRCRKGRMFEPGYFKQKMYVRCGYCDLFYERHPGYFYVSMYVSYAMNVAEMLTLSIATFVLSGGSENVWLYLGVILTAVFLLASFNYRFSRVLHMHFLDPGLRYQPDIAEKSHEIKSQVR